MRLIVDLHIHSHYSRATSRDMNLEALYRWGKIKGINIIGTGDFTHPEWFAEMREKLEPAEPGLYKLKDELAEEQDQNLPEILRDNLIRFVLTSEISNIYSKNQKVRKIHNVIVSPSFEIVSEINARLAKIGNLKADGRPILGLDSKELLRIAIETSLDNIFIPAHIWTPWFGLFGSRSGFDSLQEAFEDLTEHIYAIETGLSSDPFMNWRLSQLENLTILSNSDAHSPAKLGREANVMDIELSYPAMSQAIKTQQGMIGTIEFFPQEGKYHYNGHRLCNISLSPHESEKLNNICPKCGKPLILGVDHRVEEIADRGPEYTPVNHKQVEYIVPLVEMIAEVVGTKSTSSRKVTEMYEKICAKFGNEFFILRELDTNKLRAEQEDLIAESIDRMRRGEVYIEPGYDGVYGVVQIFKPGEKASVNKQKSLF